MGFFSITGSSLFLPLASCLLIVAHLCIEDALLYSLHTHSWLLTYWQAFVFFSLGVLVSFSATWNDSNSTSVSITTSDALPGSSGGRNTLSSNSKKSRKPRSSASKQAIDSTTRKKSKTITESLVPGIPDLPSHLTLAIRAVQSRRLKDKVAGSLTTIQFSMTTQELNYPFEAVMAALKAKYKAPNDPLNPSVRTVKTVRDIISESEANDDEDAIVAASLNNIDSSSTTTRRPFSANEGDPIATRRRDIIVGMKEVGLPSALAWALPESIIIEELSVVAVAQRCCVCTLKTGGDVSIGCLQDTCLYFSDPRNDSRTIFLQFMDLQGSSMVANALIKQLQPKDGVSFPKPPSMLAGPHIEALKGRLAELFGEEGS